MLTVLTAKSGQIKKAMWQTKSDFSSMQACESDYSGRLDSFNIPLNEQLLHTFLRNVLYYIQTSLQTSTSHPHREHQRGHHSPIPRWPRYDVHMYCICNLIE